MKCDIEFEKSFIKFWIPILKKQVFKATITNDIELLTLIRINIAKNWFLSKEQKNNILKELGLKVIWKEEIDKY
jgi:hypothetical protein